MTTTEPRTVYEVAVIGGGVVRPVLGGCDATVLQSGHLSNQPCRLSSLGPWPIAQVGSASAWRAAKRLAARGVEGGGGVLLLEQFERGHVKGSSHGDGRIFR